MTILSTATFGKSKAGLTTVGYRPVNAAGEYLAARSTEGVIDKGVGVYWRPSYEPPSGTVAVDWDTGEATPRTWLDNIGTEWESSGAGLNGPIAVTLSFLDAESELVPGAVFTIVGAGSATAGSGTYDLGLAAGTFTVVAAPQNGVIWPVTGITVTEAAAFDIIGASASTVPAPTDPSQTTAYLVTRNGQGEATGGMTIYFRLVDPDVDTDAFDRTNFSASSDDQGLLQVPLRKATAYEGKLGMKGAWVAFTTGTDATYALPAILGSYGS